MQDHVQEALGTLAAIAPLEPYAPQNLPGGKGRRAALPWEFSAIEPTLPYGRTPS